MTQPYVEAIDEAVRELAAATATPVLWTTLGTLDPTDAVSFAREPATLAVPRGYQEPETIRYYRAAPENRAILLPDGTLQTAGILGPIDSPPRDVIRKPMIVNQWADLCVCHHSRLQHSSVLGSSQGAAPRYLSTGPGVALPDGPVTDRCAGRRAHDGQPCKCSQFNTVSSKSSHVYQRGAATLKKPVAALLPGDRVLTRWTTLHGKVRLTDERPGAMVSIVKAKPRPYKPDAEAGGQPWRDRALVVATDLGESVPQTGGTPVLLLR